MAFVKFNGNSRFNPQPKPEPKAKAKPKKIKPRSDKRAKEEKEYHTLCEVFLRGKICPVTGEPATEVHHKKGRIGKLLTDVRFFLGVSRKGHKKIEENPEWAKEMGYSLDRLSKD
jgi:hypothetical protein